MLGYLEFKRLAEAKTYARGIAHGVIKDKHGDTYHVVKYRHDSEPQAGIDKRWEVHHPRYGHVATAKGSASKERPVVDTVEVRKRHRRKGIASALYRHIESTEGVTLQDNAVTRAGKAFRKKYDSER